MQATLDLDLKGIPYDVELKLINFKKEEVWVRNVVHLTYNQQKEIIGRRGVVQDITESKKAQIELELSKQKIQATLDIVKENEYSLSEAGRMAKIGYWKYEKESDTLFWSDTIHEIFGTDPKKGTPERNIIINSLIHRQIVFQNWLFFSLISLKCLLQKEFLLILSYNLQV